MNLTLAQDVNDKIKVEQYYQNLGGVEQYIEIMKTSDSNPVLLWIHGGPGFPDIPILRYFNKEISKNLTLVIWEQRGAGKSYLKNPNPGDMSTAQIVEDGLELVEILKKKFSKEKIYLAGNSWGSIIGLKMAQAQPQKFHSYIGISQVINSKRGRELTRDWLRELALKKGDSTTIAVLDSLDEKSITNDLQALMKESELVARYNVHNQDVEIQVVKARSYYDDYKLEDMMKGAFFSIEFLINDLTDINFDNLTELDIPVYLIHGRNDWTCPTLLDNEWIENLSAPKKEIIWMENSTHGPPMEEPKLFNKILIDLLQ